MQIKDLILELNNSHSVEALLKESENNKIVEIHIPSTSFIPLVALNLLKHLNKKVILITSSQDLSDKYFDDLKTISGTDDIAKVFHKFQSHDIIAQEVGNVDSFDSLKNNRNLIYIFDPESILEKVSVKDELVDEKLILKIGQDYNFNKMTNILNDYQFEKKDFVFDPGDYAVRGGIIDIFPFIGKHPFRIEFIGDAIESIREFDENSQRSLKNIEEIKIKPNYFGLEQENKKDIISFIDHNSIVFIDGIEPVENAFNKINDENYIAKDDFWEKVSSFQIIKNHLIKSGSNSIRDFHVSLHPNYNSSMKLAYQEIKRIHDEFYKIFILCDGDKRSENLKSLFNEFSANDETEKPKLIFLNEALQNGFVLNDEKIAVLTEHEIFNRTKSRTYSKKKKVKGISEKDLDSLHRGEYVVHVDYGIGIFEKLSRIKIGDSEQECVKLKYLDGDSLFVNLNYINRIQKYNSQEGVIPRISKLGSGEWDRLKARTKKRIKDIARDLITLYAQRKSAKGFTFNTDTVWQRELEASFIYEDTPDQASATEAIKKDMETSSPMDRLVCGDVGYGKTEVAIRGAFKAVMDNKQVAVLVPTTILAEQHYKTFSERYQNFPVSVASLSRFKSKKEQQEILERLKEKKLDVLIGTHRLLSKDVEFKDLGLLIIDEEHRFGVAAKEKLRKIKVNVDTLTLTATPIPRTLNFSLLGARDLSIIETPPKNRLPIETEIIKFEDDIVRKAIVKELSRGGQVYFVNDKIGNLENLQERLQKICPEARFGIGHGQMHAHQLEKVMIAFFEKKIDVLLCTKIVESGLDISNVNTILVNRADRFGLAELYQLRGRVGRSNKQAHAYFIVPGFDILSAKALRRLQAIEEFTDLSSGFKLALRDMEIRGVGNLLGAEQSGFVESMGFDLYTRVLDEAVYELKEEEFRGVFDPGTFVQKKKIDANVEIDKDAYLPDTYITIDSERFNYYQRLYDSENLENIYSIKEEIIDRFGKMSEESENLIKIVIMRIYLSNLKVSKLKLKSNKVVLFFKSENFNDDLSFGIFNNIIEFLSKIKHLAYYVKDVSGEVTLNISIDQPDLNYLEYTVGLLQDLNLNSQ
jgi:transcription-repair coupling factor (superfamily II helicase)